MAAPSAAPAEKAPWAGGELLFSGGTDWARLGRPKGKNKDEEREEVYPNVTTPAKLKGLAVRRGGGRRRARARSAGLEHPDRAQIAPRS
jgi:hypothetical protein